MELWFNDDNIDITREEVQVSRALTEILHEAQREERRAHTTDPLEDLVAALQRGEQPSLAWIVQWSELGRLSGLDPLAAAWAHSGADRAMVWLLRKTGREYLARRVEAAAKQSVRGEVARAVPLDALPLLVELL